MNKFQHSALLVGIFGLLISCKKEQSSTIQADTVGRAIIGRPQAYVADAIIDDALNNSFSERRKFAWKTLDKATRNVTIPNGLSKTIQIPAFLTWYQDTEFALLANAMFKKHQAKMTAIGFRSEDIELELRLLMSKKTLSLDSSFLQGISSSSNTGKFVHGMMGPTLFTEPMIKHYLLHAKDMMNCDLNSTQNLIKLKKEGKTKSFSPCMKEEFPKDSVMAKAVWIPVKDGKFKAMSFVTGGPEFDKIFKQGATIRIPDQGSVETEAIPTKAFVIQDRNGLKWALAALHVSTKETANWVWSSYWWSNTPNDDFGADRPKSLSQSLQNYKSCITTGFAEQDSNPLKSIQNASLTSAVKSITVMPSILSHPSPNEKKIGQYCANPFIPLERISPGHTCIGCHQGGGLLNFADTSDFRDERRVNFPGDFSIAFGSFVQMMRDSSYNAIQQNPNGNTSNSNGNWSSP